MPLKPKPNFMGGWQVRLSTTMLRYVPTPVSSSITIAGNRGCGRMRFLATLPIVLVQINKLTNIELVRQLIKAHAYWRLKGLAVDLVIWNEDRDGYRHSLQEQILGLIASGFEANLLDRPGRYFCAAGRPNRQRRPHPDTIGRPCYPHRQPGNAGRTNEPKRYLVADRIPRFRPSH